MDGQDKQDKEEIDECGMMNDELKTMLFIHHSAFIVPHFLYPAHPAHPCKNFLPLMLNPL